MPVKLRVVPVEGLPNRYSFVIQEDDGPGKVTFGPACARDLIDQARELFGDLERNLDVAARIEETQEPVAPGDTK